MTTKINWGKIHTQLIDIQDVKNWDNTGYLFKTNSAHYFIFNRVFLILNKHMNGDKSK